MNILLLDKKEIKGKKEFIEIKDNIYCQKEIGQFSLD